MRFNRHSRHSERHKHGEVYGFAYKYKGRFHASLRFALNDRTIPYKERGSRVHDGGGDQERFTKMRAGEVHRK